MKQQTLRLLSLAVLLLTSVLASAQQCFFSIDVRQPAQLSAGSQLADIHRLMLVNNSVVQPDNFGHQTKVDDVPTGTESIDLRQAARLVLLGLERSLTEQNVMDEVQVLDISQNKSSNFYKRTPLIRQYADSLCLFYDVEALLILNQIVIYDLQEVFLTDNDDHYAYLEVYCSTHWSLRTTHGNEQVFSTSDTLVWEARDYEAGKALSALPDRRNALLDMAFYSGEQVGKRLYPQWVTCDRYLYLNQNEELKAGLEAFRHQHWQEAFERWAEVYRKTADATTRAYAAANAALACEMMEDRKQADAWAEKAEHIFLQMRNREANQQVINLRYYRKQISDTH